MMENVTALKIKIEEARRQLNSFVANNMDEKGTYEKSVELDHLIEEYINIVELNNGLN
ncbi:Spo0E like sporulation regulatory protein [Lachnotalea glycerini]|uniref:Spo0E like sporulation regulatory protein n=2 Tax=Lachnotalea glycerini TaxID=1763509 RepID=A0A255IMP2_9FIRM|nr:aspartyl-phosphate phosphatase Spo0E family protein [Lachnotalea glycerini]PXV89514.1 Spo0E like sporulation regulatory protein [Lachnotalea glycerini]